MKELNLYLHDIEDYTIFEQLVGFALGLLVAAEADEIKELFEIQVRGSKSLPKPSEVLVFQALERLESDGFLTEEEDGYALDPVSEDFLPTAVYLNHPKECRTLARAYLKQNKHYTLPTAGRRATPSQKRMFTEIRGWAMALLYTDQPDTFDKLYALIPAILQDDDVSGVEAKDLVISVLGVFPAPLLTQLSSHWLSVALYASLETHEHLEPDFATSLAYLLEHANPADYSVSLVADLTTLTIERLHALPEDLKKINNFPGIQGSAALLRGDIKMAEAAFEKHLPAGKEIDFSHILSDFHQFISGSLSLDEAILRADSYILNSDELLLDSYRFLLYARNDESKKAEMLLSKITFSIDESPLYIAFLLAVGKHVSNKFDQFTIDLCKLSLIETDQHIFPYVFGEGANAMVSLGSINGADVAFYERQATTLAATYNFAYLSSRELKVDNGKKLLNLLSRIATPKDVIKPKAVVRNERLLWIVDMNRGRVEVKEQRLSKNGGYTPGKSVKLEDLVLKAYQNKLSEEDKKTVDQFVDAKGNKIEVIKSYYYEYVSGSVSILRIPRTLYYLAGHTNVVLDNRQRIPLTIKRGETRFQAIDTTDGVQLSFTPAGARDEYAYVRDNPTQFTVYKLTEEELELSQSLLVPQLIEHQQRDALERMLPQLRQSLSVDTLLDIDTTALDKMEGKPTIIAHLFPNGNGYNVEFVGQPIEDVEYFVVPGEGLPQDIVTLDPEVDEPTRVLLTRDLEEECETVAAIQSACPSLGVPNAENTRWSFDQPLPTLNMLRELQAQQKAGTLTISYPKGRGVRLNNPRDVSDVQLSIGQSKDWFSVRGTLSLDENRVLDFTQLLAHSREREGAFVKLDDGEYLEITQALQQRLDAMQGMLHTRQQGMMLPQLAANSFAELLDDFEDVELDEQWQQTVDRAKKAMSFIPVLPKGYKAELRDYQLEGFNWLMRLATWGVGACLADDMGLGKTIQALAVLHARRKEGPALVLAPASVTRNWLKETIRFAPQLSPKLVASSSDAHLIKDAKAGDVIILSYGLLSFIASELLDEEGTGKIWSTLVLDEAQAIKNPATQRAKLLFSLGADFRLAMTGTPIENNLTELWSLFRFLNPGLLGSLQAFTSKFTRPLARSGGAPVLAEQLRRLVHPFILRRRKDEVLKELPAKTETVLEVVPDAKERALYEAIRREAVEVLANATPTQKRFVVLQQLMRLRQAACHPKLVRPTSKLSSAKLALIAETIEELRANGHRALVFSQFVKHLRLVEAWVKSAGISYRYIDGSTPGKKREQLVQEFQAGEADLFLISLKAGGTGLNLTAADYVLHLDPWWNPAVEDQASDRAHRMGQQKPVTVYRFVTQGTIEESILALHAEKRDLADEMLRGSGGSASLSVEEMVEMMGE